MSEDVAITINRDPSAFEEDSSFFLKPDKMNSTSFTRDYLKFHCFTRTSNYTAMNFEIKPHNHGINYNVSKISSFWGFFSMLILFSCVSNAKFSFISKEVFKNRKNHLNNL